MNSSILNDQEFKSEIDDIFSGLEALQIDNPLDWWDLFISVVSGATISYTKRKARIKNSLKKYYETQIQLLEGIDTDDLTNAQKSTYNHHKARLEEILNVRLEVTKSARRGSQNMRSMNLTLVCTLSSKKGISLKM